MKNTSAKQYLSIATSILAVRCYARGRQIIPSKHRKTLDARPTESKSKLFAFGNFSSLHKTEKAHIEKSELAIEKILSFESLRIFPTVRAAMIQEIKENYNLRSTYIKDRESLEIKPSPVQIAAIRKICQPRKLAKKVEVKAQGNAILKGLMEDNEQRKLKAFAIAAETGSGKTWAYLASVFTKLKEDDLETFRSGNKAFREAEKAQSVRAVILVPTHDLVEQVYATASRAASLQLGEDVEIPTKMRNSEDSANFFELSSNKKTMGLRVVKWGAGDSHEKLFGAAQIGRVDLLVTTPGKIQGLAKLNNILNPFRLFSSTDYCVIDEADTLFDDSWLRDTSNVLLRFSRLKDLILCSATIPKEFNKKLKSMFKDESSIIRIVTPLIHKIPKQIVVKVIDAQLQPYQGSKVRCLAQAIYGIHNDGTEAGYVKRILVFVNEKKDVDPLVETLIKKYGHKQSDVVGVTGSVTAKDRADLLQPFLDAATPLEDDVDGSKVKVLVTTDLLARGLNFQGIKNVILMDLPRSSIDLIHRIGRTGRMKQSGRVFIIIDKKTRKSWIKGLPRAIKMGSTLG